MSDQSIDQRRWQKNLALYPWYSAASSALPWLAVFFLFLNERVSLAETVQLGGIYYFFVFLLEVPSGYLSDRLGRRPTLILSALCLVVAYGLFVNATGFFLLALAQAFLAAGIACQSGSDSALLHDTLVCLQREDEYATHEARAQQFSMMALSMSTLAGGWLGSFDLSWAYAAALLSAVVTLALATLLTEPRHSRQNATPPFRQQMVVAFGRLLHPLLLWLTLFFVFGYLLQHIPYEFYQPYIQLLADEGQGLPLIDASPPMLSGVVISISMFIGSLGAAWSIGLQQRVGLYPLLMGTLIWQWLIIAGMAWVLHPALLVLVMARNVSMALAYGPMMGAMAPHMQSGERATVLSLQSLLARLGFALFLGVISLQATTASPIDWASLARLLQLSAGCGALMVIGLCIWRIPGERA